MTRFTFIVEPWSHREYSVVAENRKSARDILWQSLSQGQQDMVAYIECVDEQPATQGEYDRQFEEGI